MVAVVFSFVVFAYRCHATAAGDDGVWGGFFVGFLFLPDDVSAKSGQNAWAET